MSGQKGLDLLLKIGATPVTVAGGRTTSISFNATTIDVTTASEVDRFRRLLDEAGIMSFSVSFEGVFRDDASHETVRAAAMSQKVETFEITVPALGTFTGGFKITSLDYSGSQEAEVTHSFSLESGSAIAFVAAS